MSEEAIVVKNIGKQYRLRHLHQGQRYSSLRDVLANAAKRIVGRGGPAIPQGTADEAFWALDDVSFCLAEGEVLGIVGRNGAGKSTLLKLLSRITEPTTGSIKLRGRIASLLEVGTGFHPELTGRENIFLNGAILGMGKTEIRRKFDQIVEFAEVVKFLDTPVKHYSSGMYVRLAFAVAAHLESEILVIDEVLAVGDAEFQRRCLGRMKEVANSGRTVLFVSHNMNAVENLCTSVLLLDKGQIQSQGSNVRELISDYLNSGVEGEASVWQNKGNELSHSSMMPLRFSLHHADGTLLTGPARNDEPLFVEIEMDVRISDPALNAGFALFNQDSEQILWSLTTDAKEAEWPKLEKGVCRVRCWLPTHFLNEGHYRLEMIGSLHFRDWFIRPGNNSPTIHFEIRGGLSESPYWLTARPGSLAPVWPWERTN